MRAISDAQGCPSTRKPSTRYLRVGKQLQIDRIRHCSVAGIIEMSVIAGVVIRSEPSGMIRIAHRSFQIDNPVKRFAGADPFIHRSTFRFAFFGVKDFSFAGQKGCSEDFEVTRMGAGDQLFETADDLIGANCSGRLLRESSLRFLVRKYRSVSVIASGIVFAPL
jgi:hypothetical protein